MIRHSVVGGEDIRERLPVSRERGVRGQADVMPVVLVEARRHRQGTGGIGLCPERHSVGRAVVQVQAGLMRLHMPVRAVGLRDGRLHVEAIGL